MLCDELHARGAWLHYCYQTKEHKYCRGALFSTYRSVHIYSKNLISKHELLTPKMSSCYIRLYGVVVVGANSVAYFGGSIPPLSRFRKNVHFLLCTCRIKDAPWIKVALRSATLIQPWLQYSRLRMDSVTNVFGIDLRVDSEYI